MPLKLDYEFSFGGGYSPADLYTAKPRIQNLHRKPNMEFYSYDEYTNLYFKMLHIFPCNIKKNTS